MYMQYMTEEQKGFDAVFRQIARFVKYKTNRYQTKPQY